MDHREYRGQREDPYGSSGAARSRGGYVAPEDYDREEAAREEYARSRDGYAPSRSRASARPSPARSAAPDPLRPLIVGAVLFIACVAALVMSMVPRGAKAPPDTAGDTAQEQDTSDDTTGDTGPDLSDLPEALHALYDKVPEARQFVLAWYDRPKPLETESIDLTGLDLSRVPALYQWDMRWGYSIYAGNYLGLSGCGPTCLSVVALYFTKDTSLNPQKVAEYATANNYATVGDGTAWTLFSQGAAGLGLSSRELALDQSLIDAALADGDLVVMVLGPGDFTTIGHYIVVTGGTGAGGYTVHDVNNPANSAKTWTFEQLKGQIRNIWAMNKAK